MSGKVVNLRTARKRKERAARDEAAATNRRLHGRTRAQREQDDLAKDKAIRHLDGHRLEQDDEPGV